MLRWLTILPPPLLLVLIWSAMAGCQPHQPSPAGSAPPLEPDNALRKALSQLDIVCKPFVFSGAAFPAVDFENPAKARELLGSYTLKTTFYDAGHHVVAAPRMPGRYGVVVQIEANDGKKLSYKYAPRLVTCYRQAQPTTRPAAGWDISVALPRELGIRPSIVREQQTPLAQHAASILLEHFYSEPDSALLLAAMEAKSGGPLLAGRHSIWAIDQRWWLPIKRELGIERYQYDLWLPPGCRPRSGSKAASSLKTSRAKTYPLLLFLHGSGERGDLLETVRTHGPLRRVDQGQKDFPFIIVAPQCPSGQWWCAQQLLSLLDDIMEKYPVDPHRVYLTGLSMGGYGTWELAAEFPERFAAIVPICGGGSPEDAARLRNIPAWIFHGARDEIVPVERSEEMAQALKKAGGSARLTVYEDAGHDSWTRAYEDPALYQWLLQQRRVGVERLTN